MGVFWNTEELAGITMENEDPSQWHDLELSGDHSGEAGHEESFRNLLGDRYEELKDRMSLEFQVTEDTLQSFLYLAYLEDQTVLLDNSTFLFRHSTKKGHSRSIMFFRRDPMGSAWQ